MFTKFLLAAHALLYFSLSVVAFTNPLDLLKELQIRALSASAVIEQQVLFGGTFIGMTIFCILGLFDKKQSLIALWILCIMTVTWLFSRGLALTARTPDNEMTYFYLAFEIIMICLLYLGIRVEKNQIESSTGSDKDAIR